MGIFEELYGVGVRVSGSKKIDCGFVEIWYFKFELRIIFEILLSFYYILFLVLLFSCVFMM